MSLFTVIYDSTAATSDVVMDHIIFSDVVMDHIIFRIRTNLHINENYFNPIQDSIGSDSIQLNPFNHQYDVINFRSFLL